MKNPLLVFFIFLPMLVFADSLQDIFLYPPDECKPRGYWIWPHGNFDYAAIEKELKELKVKGLGGVDIFDLGIADPKDVIPAGPAFMSPEQVDGIAFALHAAKKLDLKMGLIVSSSWNAGASWTPPDQAAMNFVASFDTVQGPLNYDKTLAFPVLPDSFKKSYGTFPLHVPKNDKGLPKYYLDVVTLVFPVTAEGVLDDPALVKKFYSPHVEIELPEGQWVIMRSVCANFGQMLWVPSDNSNGLSIDHFSKEAVTSHFKTIIDRLEKRCGPLNETALERLYLASYESNADVIWSPTLSEEFLKRNGYHIESFIPALFGFKIKDQETTDRFLYDFRKTVSEMFINNLYRNARDICHNVGLKICSEAGGPGPPLHDVPTEDLKALGSLDVMRGEFWVDKKNRLKPDGFEELQIVKGIASAAHIYGHKIVEMEAFTSHDSWRQSPATLKPFADRAFCEGMNRVVYHTMSHNLPEAGQPGWTYGAGTHINTNLTWWDMSSAWHSYLTRCCALLQQGQFVADVCYYYGQNIPNFTQPKHIRPSLGPGYDYDDINTEVLLTAFVKEGQLVLPSGMSYAILVLPDDNRMDVQVLKKIRELINDGATIIGPKPERVYGLANFEEQEFQLSEIAAQLWGQKSPKKLDKKIGKGRLVVGKSVRRVLQEIGVGPDVEFVNLPSDTCCDFIHRQTENEDIYFVRNTTPAQLTVDVKFRIQNKEPELWDAVSGKIGDAIIFSQDIDVIRMPLHFDPFGSIFVVFRKEPIPRFITSVFFEGKQIFPASTIDHGYLSVACQHNQFVFCANQSGRYEIGFNDGSKKDVLLNDTQFLFIDGEWDVRFPFGRGAAPIQKFDSLYSWTESMDAGTRNFSGTATYRKSFNVPENMIENRLILDLGDLHEIARVYLNGSELGISAFFPHTFDVTGIVREGENFLVVKVTNCWLNRLIADGSLPPEERYTHTNLTRGPTSATAWFEAIPKTSGLLGPVTLQSYSKVSMPVK